MEGQPILIEWAKNKITMLSKWPTDSAADTFTRTPTSFFVEIDKLLLKVMRLPLEAARRWLSTREHWWTQVGSQYPGLTTVCNLSFWWFNGLFRPLGIPETHMARRQTCRQNTPTQRVKSSFLKALCILKKKKEFPHIQSNPNYPGK